MDLMADILSSVIDTSNNMTLFDIIISSENFKTEDNEDYSL
ncbi:MAG: hypothetical protein ACOCRK_05680 [bacterium]